jgi:transposase
MLTERVASDFVQQDPRIFRPHLRGWLASLWRISAVSSMRKPKRFLTAEQKYDLWVRMLTGQVTQVQAAAEAGVDRTVIGWLRQVARDGAIAALQASRPGQTKVSAAEASELVKLAAELDRLGAVVIDQAVELAVMGGKSSWG